MVAVITGGIRGGGGHHPGAIRSGHHLGHKWWSPPRGQGAVAVTSGGIRGSGGHHRGHKGW